jgi:hypothetical protein
VKNSFAVSTIEAIWHLPKKRTMRRNGLSPERQSVHFCLQVQLKQANLVKGPDKLEDEGKMSLSNATGLKLPPRYTGPRVQPQGTRRYTGLHSGSPAFRRPSLISLVFDCPPRPIHADIVKAGSASSSRAAASRASMSRPR